MEQIIELVNMFIADGRVQGVLTLLTSAGFVGMIPMFIKLFGNKRLNSVLKQAQEALNKSDARNEELKSEIKVMRENFTKDLAEVKEYAATGKEMTKTMVLNSKAAASTKNEILKIDAVPQTAKEAVVIVESKDIPVYVDEVVEDEDDGSLDSLLSKL